MHLSDQHAVEAFEKDSSYFQDDFLITKAKLLICTVEISRKSARASKLKMFR